MKTRAMLAVLALARCAVEAGADRTLVVALAIEVTGEDPDLIDTALGATPSTEPVLTNEEQARACIPKTIGELPTTTGGF